MNHEEFIKTLKLTFIGQNQHNICQALAEYLHSSPKTIYNKIAGRSHFSVDEMMKIASHYGIAIDSIIHPQSKLNKPYPFYIRGEYFKPRSFEEYILNLHHFFKPLVDHKEYIQTTYLSREFSIFHLFHFPRLLYFKLFMWNKLNWNSIDTPHYSSEEWIAQATVKAAIETFLSLYSNLHETNIWSSNIFDTLLSQIESAVNFGIIDNDDDIKMIFRELDECLNYIENFLQTGHKIDITNSSAASISVYLNNLIVSPDMINIRIKNHLINYIMIDTPNFLESKDPDFCLSMEKFASNIKEHSVAITRANKLKRDDLLLKLRKAIKQKKTKILQS